MLRQNYLITPENTWVTRPLRQAWYSIQIIIYSLRLQSKTNWHPSTSLLSLHQPILLLPKIKTTKLTYLPHFVQFEQTHFKIYSLFSFLFNLRFLTSEIVGTRSFFSALSASECSLVTDNAANTGQWTLNLFLGNQYAANHWSNPFPFTRYFYSKIIKSCLSRMSEKSVWEMFKMC